MDIEVSSKEFQIFITSIKKINGRGSTFIITKNHIESINLTEDNCSVMLYCKINIINSDSLSDDLYKVLNISDLLKFQYLIEMNNEDTFKFSIKNNYIYFSNKKIKGAKFILLDEPSVKIPKNITSKWFNSLKRSFSCNISKSNYQELIKAISFSNSTEKVYIYTKENELIGELNDFKQDNVDNIALCLSESYTGEIKNNVILHVSTLPLINIASKEFLLEASEIKTPSSCTTLLLLTVEVDGVFIIYLLNSKID